jgi:DNA primase
VVTTACADKVAGQPPLGEGTYIDFAHLKQQLSLERVLGHLGLTQRLRGSGAQRRCACPIHRADGRGRTFRVNLKDNVFHCFDARCGKQGDVIDLWAAWHQLDLRAAALDLVRTVGLEPAPANPTEKRNG